MHTKPIIVKTLLDEEQMDHKIALYAKVTIAPNEALDNHAHHGETEIYFILSGAGTYDDNGKKVSAKVGDVFFCKDGDSHGIVCASEDPLVFMALIINK